jgi:type II restriction enzyme
MIRRTTPTDLVHAINELPKDRAYSYVSPTTRTRIQILDVILPEGPIRIRRYNPSKGIGPGKGAEQTISIQMLWRIANAISINQPINFDRVLGGSYNTRSALEALLANTPEFYYCYPGRVEVINSSTEIKKGHKHLIWLPDEPHEAGTITENKTKRDMVIVEVPSTQTVYESLTIPEPISDLDIEIQRRHAQIQVALIYIGLQLGSRVWIAQNDKAIIYNGRRIGEMQGVIASLGDERLLAAYHEAQTAARLIDCVWFRNTKFMPAVFEIEHTTGVTSGLTRMKNFQDAIPSFPTRWVIVAADEDRNKVIKEANKPQFASLNAQYFPYSAVAELHGLCQRRHLRGVTDDFLDCFIEPCSN